MKPVLREEIQVQTIELVRLTPEQDVLAAPQTPGEQLRSTLRRRLPFVLIVVLPTILAAVYFFGLAASRYVSEVEYVVRTPSSSSASEIASLVQGSTVMRSSDDAYLAREYILSREAMQALVDHDRLLDMFSGAGRDIFWRFPGLFRQPTVEDMAKHYERFVDVEYDSSSGISKLRMQAFDPADAQRLAAALLVHTEAFLNNLNTRAQRDAVQSALKDVEDAKQTAYAALDKVTALRNTQQTVDPTKASTGVVTAITTMSLELSSTNARLAELTANTPSSPELPTLRTRIAALQAQIGKLRQQLGGDTASLAPQIADYERLLLEQTFAEKSFVSALASLEAARLDASRQRVFIEQVTNPDLPDRPAYPYRTLLTLAAAVVSYAVWRVFNAVGRDTREHANK